MINTNNWEEYTQEDHMINRGEQEKNNRNSQAKFPCLYWHRTNNGIAKACTFPLHKEQSNRDLSIPHSVHGLYPLPLQLGQGNSLIYWPFGPNHDLGFGEVEAIFLNEIISEVSIHFSGTKAQWKQRVKERCSCQHGLNMIDREQTSHFKKQSRNSSLNSIF